mmetsp:Transcript_6628/g.11583  ORF Transcript_6628/g.11583 Transcript_6628/m.11583 type:complete len:276 (-) Transcript_6628:320-1147(-)
MLTTSLRSTRRHLAQARFLSSRPPPPPPPPPRRPSAAAAKPDIATPQASQTAAKAAAARPRAAPAKSHKQAKPAKKTNTRGFLFLVAAVGGVYGGLELLRRYEEHQKEEALRRRYEGFEDEDDSGAPDSTSAVSSVSSWLGLGSGKKDAAAEKEAPVDSSRDFLAELAAKGDADASKILDDGAAKKDDEKENGTEGGDDFSSSEGFRVDISRQGLIRTLKMMLDMKRKQEGEEIARIRKLPIDQRPYGYEESLRQLREEKAEIKVHLKALLKHNY